MIDPDTPHSLPGDTPSGQDPATARYGDEADTARDDHRRDAGRNDDADDARAAAPDPQAVKSAGDDSPAAKDPAAWVTGDEPMTGPQASYLETLAQQAGETPPAGLTKAEASRAIDELRSRTAG